MSEYEALMNGILRVTKIIPQQKQVVPVSAESASTALNLSREFLQVSKRSTVVLCIRHRKLSMSVVFSMQFSIKSMSLQ